MIEVQNVKAPVDIPAKIGYIHILNFVTYDNYDEYILWDYYAFTFCTLMIVIMVGLINRFFLCKPHDLCISKSHPNTVCNAWARITQESKRCVNKPHPFFGEVLLFFLLLDCIARVFGTDPQGKHPTYYCGLLCCLQLRICKCERTLKDVSTCRNAGVPYEPTIQHWVTADILASSCDSCTPMYMEPFKVWNRANDYTN